MMQDGTRPDLRLRRWQRGDPLTAKHLNEPVDAIVRLHAGVAPPSQVRSRGNPAPFEVRAFKVLADLSDDDPSVQGDYVWCERQGGSTSSEGEGDRIAVAKPYLLRRTTWDTEANGGDAESRNGVTYEYTSGYERTATITATGQEEDQIIVPSYQAGDVIYAVRGVMGGTGVEIDNNGDTTAVEWLDLNADGRMWGQV